MNTPTTEAGKAHLEDWFDTVKDAWGAGSVNRESMESTIAAIEAEAVAAVRAKEDAGVECPCCGDWFTPCNDPDHTNEEGMCAFCATNLHDVGAGGCRQ